MRNRDRVKEAATVAALGIFALAIAPRIGAGEPITDDLLDAQATKALRAAERFIAIDEARNALTDEIEARAEHARHAERLARRK